MERGTEDGMCVLEPQSATERATETKADIVVGGD